MLFFLDKTMQNQEFLPFSMAGPDQLGQQQERELVQVSTVA